MKENKNSLVQSLVSRSLKQSEGGSKEVTLPLEISCWQNFVGFFKMAKSVFVEDSTPEPTDIRLGYHLASCKCPICKDLASFYFDNLKGTTSEDSKKVLAQSMEKFEELLLGKVRQDLEGQPTIYYDTKTGKDITVKKAVEITDKCIKSVPGMRKSIVYMDSPNNSPKWMQLLLELPGSSSTVGFKLDSTFSFTNIIFEREAGVMGIDPELLFYIVLANKPDQRPRQKK